MTTAKEVILPVELMSLIANGCSVVTLKSLALVSSRWTPLAQAKLFRYISWCGSVTGDTRISDLDSFLDLVGTSKYLCSLVSGMYLGACLGREEDQHPWEHTIKSLVRIFGARGDMKYLHLETNQCCPRMPIGEKA